VTFETTTFILKSTITKTNQ